MPALCSLEYRSKKQNSTFSLSIKFYCFLSFVFFGDFWFPLSLWGQTQEGLCLQVPRNVTGGNSKRGGWAPSLYFHINRICSKKSIKMSVTHTWIHLIKQSQIGFTLFGVGFFTFPHHSSVAIKSFGSRPAQSERWTTIEVTHRAFASFH